jgi:hypothetical protein
MSQQAIIAEIINELTAEIKSRKDKVLPKIGKFLNQKEAYTFQQFNGLFGGKNNTYVDSVRTQFVDFEDFFAQWLKGLIDKYEVHKQKQKDYYGKVFTSESSIERIYGLLRDAEVRYLVRIFLERNFYKQLNERTRTKPSENLWSVWFGYKLTYGLLIAPKLYGETWINDKSEIRRVEYSYWTIGHVLSEGLIDPDSNKIYRFKTLDDFLIFYESILKRLSVSPYEHAFYDLYVNYLRESKNVKQEPLLIPELRYKGLEKKHIHRLDFTLFNVHTSAFIGFELSPASTHMSIENLKKKQYEVNNELSEKWGKEMTKRNDYFKDFDITIITFTDSDLKDIKACFEVVKEKLKARKIKVNLQTQLDRLGN